MTSDDDAIAPPDMPQRRYRSFVARPVEDTQATIKQDQHSTHDDIPLLTEVIDTQAAQGQNVSSLLATLRGEIESEVSSWLVDVLPVAVANASQQILDELDNKARNALLPRLNTLIETHRASEDNTDEASPSQ